MSRPEFAQTLDDAHALLERDQSLEVDRLDADPERVAGRLVDVLVSAKRLPITVVIRVAQPPRAEATFRSHCRARAESSWAQATTIRRAGTRQLGPCLLAAAAAMVVATVCGTLAQSASSHLLAALLYAIAGVGVISAWVIAWMPIEELLFDWRPARRTASAYDLLARARFEATSSAPVNSGRSERDTAPPVTAAQR